MKHLVYRVLRKYDSGEKYAGVHSCTKNYYNDQIVEIPNYLEIDGEFVPVEYIGPEAFKGENILGVLIPSNVRDIGGSAFQNCKHLKSITIPSEMDRIHWGTFLDCTSLEEVIIPKKVSRISEKVFEGCTNLKKINFTENLTEIRESAFQNCKRIKSIVLSRNLLVIKQNAFKGCENLTFYSEFPSMPPTWDLNWKDSNRPIYWVNEWHYDNEGNPQPNINVR